MPAVSKAQKKLFQLALAVKKGLVDKNKVDDKIKDLSKKPEKDLKDYAETPDKKLPSKLEENSPMATPASVNGMGDVSLPGNPTTQDGFSTQETGSGDLAATSALTDGNPDKNGKKAKKMYKFLKYNAFVGESLNEKLTGHAKKMKEDGISDKEIKKMHPEVTDDDLQEEFISEDVKDAAFNLDKIFGDDQESIEKFQDIEDNGTVEDMIHYIEEWGNEEMLKRYGIRSSGAVKNLAKHIMRKR